MKVTLETQGGGVDTPANGDHAPAVRGDPAFRVRTLPRTLRVLLASCVGIEAVLVSWLAIWNATLTRSVWDLIGSVLLFAIAITCALALHAILRDSTAALMTTIISQTCIAVWASAEYAPADADRPQAG